MTKQLFQKLGIDVDLLSQEEVLEQLQQKNLEYLERLDNCSDEGRAKELKEAQAEIEEAILVYSSGVSLTQQVQARAAEAAQTAAPAASAAPDAAPTDEQRYYAALQDYQAGNGAQALPVLEEFARKGDPTASMLTACLLLERNGPGDAERAKELLGRAVDRGDGVAALALANVYIDESNYPMAERFAVQALNLGNSDSAGLLVKLVQRPESRIDTESLIRAAECSDGYERYEFFRCAYGRTLSDEQKKRLQKIAEDDPACGKLLKDAKEAKATAVSQQKKEKSQRAINTILRLINGIVVSLIVYLAFRSKIESYFDLDEISTISLAVAGGITFLISFLYKRREEPMFGRIGAIILFLFIYMCLISTAFYDLMPILWPAFSILIGLFGAGVFRKNT